MTHLVESRSNLERKISTEDLVEVRRLFREKPTGDQCYTFFAGGTYLHYAASHPSVAMVEALIDIGFDVNKPVRRGGYGVTVACSNGHLEVAK